jgi:hypothetical protein
LRRSATIARKAAVSGLERGIMQKGATPVDKFEWSHSNQHD